MAPTTTRQKRRSALILGGLLPFDPARLPSDVIAGATLAALAIPEVMGYTKIAGTPVITGLYTLLLPIVALRDPRARRATWWWARTPRPRRSSRPGSWPWARRPNRPSTSQMASLAALMCGVLLIALDS